MPTTRITVTSCPSRSGGGGTGTGTGEGAPVPAAAKTESTVVDPHGVTSAAEKSQDPSVVLNEDIGEKQSPMAAAAAETDAAVEEDTAVSKVEDVVEVDEIMEGRSKDHDETMVETRDAASTSNNPDDETEDAATVGVAAVTVKHETTSSSAPPVDNSRSTPFDEKQVEEEHPTAASPSVGGDEKNVGLNTETNGVNENDTSYKNFAGDDNDDHREPLTEQQEENRPVIVETPFNDNAATEAVTADDGVKAAGPLNGETDVNTSTGTTAASQQVEQTVSNSDKNESSTGDDSAMKEEEGEPREKQSQQEAGGGEPKEEEKKDETDEETNINASLGGAKVRPK